ncbi:MAG: hypothetical protein ABEJ28_06505 [Salinigranum sp.]
MNRYRGSDGRRYTDDDLWEKLESETWRVCCWDTERKLQVFENDRDELVFLRPLVDPSPVIRGNADDPL